LKYCNNCHKQFLAPKESNHLHIEVTERDREYFGVCPHCGSSDYEEMKLCELCATSVKSSEDYCEEHKEFVIDLMVGVMDSLYKYSFADRKKCVALIEWWIGEETK